MKEAFQSLNEIYIDKRFIDTGDNLTSCSLERKFCYSFDYIVKIPM